MGFFYVRNVPPFWWEILHIFQKSDRGKHSDFDEFHKKLNVKCVKKYTLDVKKLDGVQLLGFQSAKP